MIIVLNPKLSAPKLYAPSPKDSFERNILGKLDNLPNKHYKLAQTMQGDAHYLNVGYLGLASKAYSQHFALEVAPHDLWYIVLTELAGLIKQNVEACRPLFTTEPEKVDICVNNTGGVMIDLEAIMAKLLEKIPMDTSVLLPDLSTHTRESRIACIAALADGVQHYYSYSMMLCGIPAIDLTGTEKDWTMLVSNAILLAEQFAGIGLDEIAKYLNRIRAIFTRIAVAFVDGDINHNFWKDIYTHQNVGSGGELIVSGWIGMLYFKVERGMKLTNFSSTISVVPYLDRDTGIVYRTVHGGFKGVVTSEGILQCQYGNMVFSVEEGEEPHGIGIRNHHFGDRPEPTPVIEGWRSRA